MIRSLMSLSGKCFGLWLCVIFVAGCVGAMPKNNDEGMRFLIGIPSESRQAILVRPVANSQADLTAWEKKNGRWVQKFTAMPAMVGRSGVAARNDKREGDGKTPSGVFLLKQAFGYAGHIDTGLSYRQATQNDFWVDDVKSSQYNQWVAGKPEAASFEEMKRKDELYKLGAVIEYNTDPIVPGRGSAIFLHIWRDNGKPTSGCVALSENNIEQLLSWLDGAQAPVIIIQAERENP